MVITPALPLEALRTRSLSIKETPCTRDSRAAVALPNLIVTVLRPPAAVTRNALPITVCGGVPAASPVAVGPCPNHIGAALSSFAGYAQPELGAQLKNPLVQSALHRSLDVVGQVAFVREDLS